MRHPVPSLPGLGAQNAESTLNPRAGKEKMPRPCRTNRRCLENVSRDGFLSLHP